MEVDTALEFELRSTDPRLWIESSRCKTVFESRETCLCSVSGIPTNILHHHAAISYLPLIHYIVVKAPLFIPLLENSTHRCMFVTSYCLFLTKPRCSLTSTKLLFPTNVSTVRRGYFQWNSLSENCSSTPFHPKPVSYGRPVVAIAVYSILNDLEKRKFDGLEPYRSLGNENEQPEANSFARDLACSCSIGDGWCITRSGVDAPPSPLRRARFPALMCFLGSATAIFLITRHKGRKSIIRRGRKYVLNWNTSRTTCRVICPPRQF